MCRHCGFDHKMQPRESEKAHTAMVCDVQLALVIQWMDPFQGIEHPNTGMHSRMKVYGWWDKIIGGKIRVYNEVYIRVFNHATEVELFSHRFRRQKVA